MSETIERTRGSVALFAYPNAANTKRRNLMEKFFRSARLDVCGVIHASEQNTN